MREAHAFPGRPFRPSPEMPANIESAYAKAAEVSGRQALQLESFIHEDGANRAIIENDLAYVARRRLEDESTHGSEYKLAKALEVALHERVNNDGWFGDRAHMIMPSDYDDLANGNDGVLEFHEQAGAKSYLGLAIDVTFYHDPGKKFEIIKEQIDESRLGTVKYFRSSDNTFEGRLKNVPRAVVMLNAADATRMVRDWDAGADDQHSPLRGLILRQLEKQLSAYQTYARRLEAQYPKRLKISQFFEGARRNVEALLGEVVKPEELAVIDKHPSMRAVEQYLEDFGFVEQPLAA